MNTLLVSLLGALLLSADGPDRVKLNDGKVLEGRVVLEGRDAVVIRENRTNKTVPRSEIAELVTLERSLAPIVARDFPAADVEALEALALECEEALLTKEARLMWLRVLLADKDSEKAIKALDARKQKFDVAVPFGKESRDLTTLRLNQPKWKQAYELETTHFVLRTDADLPQALDIAQALERFHARFYDLLGPSLELYVFDERELPELRVFAESAGVPNAPAPSQRVWYAAGENCLYIAADTAVHIPTVVSELSRQMLFTALRRSAGPTAQIPPWVTAGIAEYFAMAAPSQRGLPWHSPDEPFVALFQETAKSKLRFQDVFNEANQGFTDGPRAREFSAAAYTLLHFLTRDRNGDLRAPFGRYVHEGAKGKLSMGNLTEQLGMKADEIDKAWREYVATHAK